jgi:phosphonate transport system substrate-binding protein
VDELHLRAEDFRVLWTSQMIPGTPYCVRKDLPPSLKSAFRQAFLNLKDEKILAALKISGFAPAADSEYQLIRDLRRLNQWH